MGEGQGGQGQGGAADASRDPVAALEARLGVRVLDRAAGLAALTHKSYVNEHREDGLQDNERLEFLGDAVIDLAVSHRLMERFPAAREGDLSKMRAAVVDEPGLAGMARALDLGPLLRLGRGEELTGGREKASLLADAMEAVIAAVYQGQGLGPVLEIVDRFLGEAFARAIAGTLDRDFKTQLQELAQSRLRATPRYRVVAEHGPDHSKLFDVETDLRGEALGRGRGRSKKDAEQAAAKVALEVLGRRLGAERQPGGGVSAEVAAPPVAAASPPDLPPAPPAPAVEDTAAGATPSPVEPPPEPAEEAEPRARTETAAAAAPAPVPGEPAAPAEAPPVEAAPAPRRRAAPRKRPAPRRAAPRATPARTPKKAPPRAKKKAPARKGSRPAR